MGDARVVCEVKVPGWTWPLAVFGFGVCVVLVFTTPNTFGRALIAAAGIWYGFVVAWILSATTTLDEAGNLELKGLLRRRQTNVTDVRRINKPRPPMEFSSITIRFDGGWAMVAGPGALKLADRVLAQNPTVKVYGGRR
jgi:hypothetical protein